MNVAFLVCGFCLSYSALMIMWGLVSRARWRKAERELQDAIIDACDKEKPLDPFDVWRNEFNTVARQIDIAIDYDASDYVPAPVLKAHFRLGYSPEFSLYHVMTVYKIGEKHGLRIDGTGRKQGYMATPYPRFIGGDLPMPIFELAQGVGSRLYAKAQNQLGARQLKIARENILTKFKPLAVGLEVKIYGHKNLTGTITSVVKSEVDKRPMYEVVLHHNNEVVHARAIDLWWKGRKK